MHSHDKYVELTLQESTMEILLEGTKLQNPFTLDTYQCCLHYSSIGSPSTGSVEISDFSWHIIRFIAR